jgi:hypothetical protein
MGVTYPKHPQEPRRTQVYTGVSESCSKQALRRLRSIRVHERGLGHIVSIRHEFPNHLLQEKFDTLVAHRCERPTLDQVVHLVHPSRTLDSTVMHNAIP